MALRLALRRWARQAPGAVLRSAQAFVVPAAALGHHLPTTPASGASPTRTAVSCDPGPPQPSEGPPPVHFLEAVAPWHIASSTDAWAFEAAQTELERCAKEAVGCIAILITSWDCVLF